MPKRPQLTPQIQQQICSYLRAGGFLHIAAEAAGIPRRVFEDWLRRGQRLSAKPLYRHFWEDVQQARAQARLKAELAVFDKAPLNWLKYGPGRETPDYPGWTNAGKPQPPREGNVNLFLGAEIQALVASVLQALAPYPEARAAVARVLAGSGQPPPSLPGSC